ncbi:MAG: hypothetical protein ACI4NA_01560 [Succinivibrio sp.]
MTDTPNEPAAPLQDAPATSPEQAKGLMAERLGAFLASCGAPEDSYSFTDFSSRQVAIDARYMWKLEVKVKDEQADTARVSNLALLSSTELEKNTKAVRDQFSSDEAVLSAAVERDSGAGFHALCKMLKKVNVTAKKDMYGYAVCPRCHGSRAEKCRSCQGTGQIKCPDCGGRGDSCPRCQGRGYLNCPECSGRGVATCAKCHGKGLTGVRRSITQQVVRSCSFSYAIGSGKDATDGSELSERDRAAMCAETAFEKVRMQQEGGTCIADFSGRNSYHQIKVKLRGSENEFLCTACGDRCELISRPFLFDNLCAPFLKQVSDIVSSRTHSLSSKQAALCDAMASNGIIAATVRGMDAIVTTAYEDGCKRFGLAFSKLAEAESNGDQGFGVMQAKVRPEITRRVAALLRQNASFFASEPFCGEVAARLVSLLPLMTRRDPDSGLIWNAACIVTWFTTGVALFLAPYVLVAAMFFFISLLSPFAISFFGTRSLLFYLAASRLRMTHLGKKMPDMKPDALAAVKYLFVNTAVIVIMLAVGA